MKNILKKELIKLNKKEEKLINKKEGYIKTKLNPFTKKIENVIPKKLEDTLENAFYKGFKIVLEQGSQYIERSYNKEEIEFEHEINDYAIKKKLNRKTIKKMDNQSKKSRFINKSISTVEGAGFGLLGIGLPDIPLFLAMIIKTVFEISLSYGFDYDKEEEKIYILNLISAALSNPEDSKRFNQRLDRISEKIDSNIKLDINFEDTIKETSNILSDSLLVSKFIQGLPVVGVLGGITNYNVINKISNFAKIKYKKRYLLKNK